MRLTVFTLLALCLIAGCRSAEEEYDYEEEQVAAPVTPAPVRPAGRLGLLSARGRPQIGRKPAPASSTTAKPVEEPVEEEVASEETVEEGQEQEEVPTTTTEASKKIRGGVRPFRSNDDLLAALKRRRAQVGSSHTTRESAAPEASNEPTTPKPKSASSNGRVRGGESPVRASRGRFGSSRTATTKPVQEEVEETQQEEVQVKPRSFRRG